MAPEVLARDFNEKCDIWSIAMIMYNMLSEKPLFSCLDDKSVAAKLKKGEFDFNSIDFSNKS